MTTPLILTPVRLSPMLQAEIVVRLALAGFLAWVGTTDPDQGVALLMCGMAAVYHISVAARIAAFRLPSATGLTVDSSGITLRQLWRDRKLPWASIKLMETVSAKPFAGQRAGIRFTLGDSKGPTGTVAIPDVFAPGPNELLAELQRRVV